jgi:hypothetical protein
MKADKFQALDMAYQMDKLYCKEEKPMNNDERDNPKSESQTSIDILCATCRLPDPSLCITRKLIDSQLAMYGYWPVSEKTTVIDQIIDSDLLT